MSDQWWNPARQGGGAIPFRNRFDQARDPLTARNAIGAVGEAPADGQQYAREDGAWAVITTGTGGGNVSNSGTPTAGQYAKWTAATTIQGVSTATVLSDIGALSTSAAASTYQPLDGDLTAIAALTGTNTIYYRSAASTWTAVSIGSNLTFSGGTLSASTGGSVTVAVQKFTASGTYTPTSSMKYCVIELVGGGGGGGGVGNTATATASIGGGGGGSGGYSRLLASAATIGASQTVTIGAAGTAGSAGTGGNGGAGGATSVGTLCVANGGAGGLGQASGTLGGGAGGNLTGAVGDVTATGMPGDGGASAAATLALSGGGGGSSFFGGGGLGPPTGTAASSVGAAGSNYGGGGSGAVGNNVATARTGGAGSAGYVIITEYI